MEVKINYLSKFEKETHYDQTITAELSDEQIAKFNSEVEYIKKWKLQVAQLKGYSYLNLRTIQKGKNYLNNTTRLLLTHMFYMVGSSNRNILDRNTILILK